MLGLILLVLTVICGSALMSMVEAALLSLPMMRARVLHKEKRRHAHVLLRIKEDIHITIASIVVINNAINVAGSIFIGEHVTLLFGDAWLGLTAFSMTLLIIIMGEVIPKTIGERYKVQVSLFFARPVRILVFFLRPFVKIILRLERPLSRRFESPIPKVTEEEIKLMLKLGRDAGTVEMDEEILCNRVFRLNDLRAFQIMRPLDQIYALPADKSLAELREAIINARFSRIAVYDKDARDFVGMVQQRVLLREMAQGHDAAKVRDFMSEPIFINWSTKADELLEVFQAYNQHLFIVQNAEGKDVGIVTMEDVLEELFGEIYDEKDVMPKVGSPRVDKPSEHDKVDLKSQSD